MKKTFDVKINNKEAGMVFRLDKSFNSISDKLKKYHNKRGNELNNQANYIQYKTYLDTKHIDLSSRNNKDKNKKHQEFFKFLKLSYHNDIEYEIVNISDELYDICIQTENTKIGIEITELVTNQDFKEFENVIRKKVFIPVEECVFNRSKHERFLLEIELDEQPYYSNKKEYLTQLKEELIDIINRTNLITRKIILKHEFSPNGYVDIYFSNTPNINCNITFDCMNGVVNKKDSNLTNKLENEIHIKLDVNEKWLYIYTQGMFAGDYAYIDKDLFQKLESKHFDRIIFFDNKREHIYISFLR